MSLECNNIHLSSRSHPPAPTLPPTSRLPSLFHYLRASGLTGYAPASRRCWKSDYCDYFSSREPGDNDDLHGKEQLESNENSFAQYVWLFCAEGFLSSGGRTQLHLWLERTTVYAPSNGRYGILTSSIIQWHHGESKGWTIVYIAFSNLRAFRIHSAVL